MGAGSTNQSPPSLLFFFFFFFFFWGGMRSTRALFSCTLQAKDQSTVAQRTETTVEERSLECCVRARFPDRFPRYGCTAVSQPTPTWLDRFKTMRLPVPQHISATTCFVKFLTLIWELLPPLGKPSVMLFIIMYENHIILIWLLQTRIVTGTFVWFYVEV